MFVLQILIRRRILQKKALRPVVFGQRASLQSLDHVALGVIPKSRPNSGYWNPALEQEEIVSPCLLVNQHYARMPMQYVEIFKGCKNDNFQMKKIDIFFVLLIDFGYTLEPPH